MTLQLFLLLLFYCLFLKWYPSTSDGVSESFENLCVNFGIWVIYAENGIDFSNLVQGILKKYDTRDYIFVWLALMCYLVASGTYTRSFCEFLGKNKPNFSLWEFVQLQPRMCNMTFCWKMTLDFSRYSSYIYRWGGQIP